ncbi:ImuA family protein [Pseudorhodobacter sp. MZDSW-24AT]|uniref:ImuA family protein n=1 Tax=Pseudorhodobacter sp. MZDSW-24AT TaxID=2052957 RepID=UPI000C1F6AFE|nr:hypothetical protein [Pseudorhodobacter sp. MZDSW-24AT]PJF08298.1 hypothetical protein CUR21_15810 [Pseudorhodobacter sp. MZDSW-24AT]
MTPLRDLTHRTAPADPLSLLKGRVHEAEGPGRRAFALFQARRHSGTVLWILPAYEPQRPMLHGLPEGVSERLLVLTPKNETDLLWCVEEALRANPVGLVIAEPQQMLSLTAGRRLQLAAEAGQSTGLLLIRTDHGSAATETRWHCAPLPAPDADSTLHCWSTKKNKKGTIGSWVLNWNGTSAAFDMVSAAGERSQPAQPAC